ncbi:aspartate kinase [Desnuesiella massiliensis]|uniref:aspartate kinase n=1 Tax=Desnuesiella massiliensis TaxID=1650662 RepID=UPI0006E1E86D|nr:aspartate kinase [Desnuesiella massiliensis]
MKILVQKFGGTSVSSNERRNSVVNKILQSKQDGYSPVVVVSAMGRKGEPYATDTLLSLVSNRFKSSNAQSADLLMSCGEIISTVVLCNHLWEKGIKCLPITGGQAGIITDDNYSDAKVLEVDNKKLVCLLEEGIVPIVSGFQGVSREGYITTLGRGGSDVTAALLGVALKAEEIQIYTDVDGIMTADPRIVKDACLINKISYNEVFQFADQGAKVIHPRAVEIAMRGNIPLTIKNTMSECEGTIIDNYGEFTNDSLITGITHMSNRLQVNIEFENNKHNENYDSILDILADHCISIDLINIFPDKKTFTVDSKDKFKIETVLKDLQIKYESIEDCSKIAIIGSRIRGIPGVMAKILKVLRNENIKVLQTADSHTTIWCLVEGKSTGQAINALHRAFKLG